MKDLSKRKYLLSLLSFLAVFLLWELVWLTGGSDESGFPAPTEVISSGWELILNGTLVKHIVASLFRVTLGFYLAVALAIPLGIVIGSYRSADNILNPLIQFMRPISPLAWIPIAMLWFGIGDQPAIFLIFLACFFPLVLATSVAVTSINRTYFQVAANFKFSSREILTKIIVPAITPKVTVALRMTMGIAWMVVVAAEMIAVQSGLGYLILDSRNALRMDYVIVGMIAIGFIGLLLDIVMRRMCTGDSVVWATRGH